jgi:hypothetical protein
MGKKYISPRLFANDRGMVLLTTIIMLALVSSLVLSLWQGVLQLWKVYNLAQWHHEELYRLEIVSSQFKRLNFDSCSTTSAYPHEVLQTLNSNCFIVTENHKYNYILSQLANYPCLQMQYHKKLYGTQHWLLSLRSNEDPTAILQLRIAQPKSGLICVGNNKVIKQGILSWRYFHLA